MSIYTPFTAGTFNCVSPTGSSAEATKYGEVISGKINSIGNGTNTRNGILRIKDAAHYTSLGSYDFNNTTIAIQADLNIDAFKEDGTFKSELVDGLKYTIDEYVIKEMWKATVIANGATNLPEIWLAKDEEISLPTPGNRADGATFKCWEVTINGEATEYAAGAKITATEFNQDITIKAIWNEQYIKTPTSYTSISDTSIRDADAQTNDTQGMRFMASVNGYQRASASQYGFIVARSSALTKEGIANTDFAMDSAVTKVTGIAYNKVGETVEVDKVYRFFDDASVIENGQGAIFTAVLYNIPAKNYADKLVCRPYAVIYGTTYYGDPIEFSILEIAQAILDTDSTNETANKVVADYNATQTSSN